MTKYLIAYEHFSPSRTADAVNTCIESLGQEVAHILKTVWVIETDDSVEQITKHLSEDDEDGKDRFIVVTVSSPWGGVGLEDNRETVKLLGTPDFTK